MRKRGSFIVGNTLVTLPVFILILVVMAFFIFVAASDTFFDKPESTEVSLVGERSFLIEVTDFWGNENLVLDALIREKRERVSEGKRNLPGREDFIALSVLDVGECAIFDLNLDGENGDARVSSDFSVKKGEGVDDSRKKGVFAADSLNHYVSSGLVVRSEISVNLEGDYLEGEFRAFSGGCFNV